MPSDKQSKLKSLLNKLPKPPKTLVDLLCIGISICAFSLFAARIPELHNLYLREHVGSKVYKIQAVQNGGGGTGFQLKAPSGINYVVTNSHVCDHIAKVDSEENKGTALVVDDAGNAVRRRIVAISDETDLCILEGMPGVDGLSLGSEPSMGEEVTVVGHPHLRPLQLSKGEITGTQDVQILDHVISTDNPFLAAMLNLDPNAKCDQPKNEIKTIDLDGFMGGKVVLCLVVTRDAYMTSVVIYPGNSGSPLINWYGNVIGVAFAADNSDNYGDVVNLTDIKDFLSHY
jgi:hypothetical protein